MDKIEKIKKRIEIGYTMSVYGTKENLYWTMRKDIQTLMIHIDKQKLPIDLVSKRYHFEWENENNETQNFYYSATNEETAMNEFYSHYPNAKTVMVSWKLNVC